MRKFLFFRKKKLDFLSWNSLHGKAGVDRSGMEEEKPGRTFSPSQTPPIFPPVTPLRSEFNFYSVAKCFPLSQDRYITNQVSDHDQLLVGLAFIITAGGCWFFTSSRGNLGTWGTKRDCLLEALYMKHPSLKL